MTKPRFVAGAVCPSCGALDRIVVEVVAGEKRKRCVACGFVERAVSPAPGIIKGRLEKPRVEVDPQPVRVLDPPPKR